MANQSEAIKRSNARLIATHKDYESVFGTKEGQRVLRHLMREHFVMEVSQGTAEHVNFTEGQRYVVLKILKTLRMDIAKLHDQIIQAEKEGEIL